MIIIGASDDGLGFSFFKTRSCFVVQAGYLSHLSARVTHMGHHVRSVLFKVPKCVGVYVCDREREAERQTDR